MNHWKPTPHGLGGRVSQATIDEEVRHLRRYLKRPRTLAQIAAKFEWSERTAIRRTHLVGRVWRVVPPMARTALYAVAPPEWKT